MKYWKSIDELPIYYYYKVISTKDLIHLAYDLPANQNREYLTKTLQPAWDKIQIEYFDFMAKDKDFIASLEKDIRYQIKMIKANISSLAYDKIAFEGEKILKEKEDGGADFDYHQSIAYLENSLKFAIDDKKMSVVKYFSHFNRLKNGK
tara:strand:- start:727 stop:1173 length:447 start_codon:yes stop_codon:yes gene_type:complete